MFTVWDVCLDVHGLSGVDPLAFQGLCLVVDLHSAAEVAYPVGLGRVLVGDRIRHFLML
jgi:hypothetical protein